MSTTRAAELWGWGLSGGRCRYCRGGAKRRSLRVKSGAASPMKRHSGQCGVPSAPMAPASPASPVTLSDAAAPALPCAACMLTQRTPWVVQTSIISAPPPTRASTHVAAKAECRLASAIQAMSHQPRRRAKDRFTGVRCRRGSWRSMCAGRVRLQRHQSHSPQMVHRLRVVVRGCGQTVGLRLEGCRCIGHAQCCQMGHYEGGDEQAAMQRQRRKTQGGWAMGHVFGVLNFDVLKSMHSVWGTCPCALTGARIAPGAHRRRRLRSVKGKGAQGRGRVQTQGIGSLSSVSGDLRGQAPHVHGTAQG